MNDIVTRYNETIQLANEYGYKVHVFDQFYDDSVDDDDDRNSERNNNNNPSSKQRRRRRRPTRTLAYYAKYAWYAMMNHLFHTMHVSSEALVVEDDAVISYDGLLVASKLFQLKSSEPYNSYVQSITLGGWAGSNLINAKPSTLMIIRPKYYQAMVYSINGTIFDTIQSNFRNSKQQQQQREQERRHNSTSILDSDDDDDDDTAVRERSVVDDWTEEITIRHLVTNLTMMRPSVSRMKHIGIHGMGVDGNASTLRENYPTPWLHWNATIHDQRRTRNDFYLHPKAIGDH